jgi:hypothetical protein
MASEWGSSRATGGAAKSSTNYASVSGVQARNWTGCGGSGRERPCAKESSEHCNQHACRLHANRDVRKSVLTLGLTGFYGADRSPARVRSAPLRSINVHARPHGVHLAVCRTAKAAR